MKLKLNGQEITPQSGVTTIGDLMIKMGVNRGAVITVLNGQITVEEEELKEGDEIRIISAVSGG